MKGIKIERAKPSNCVDIYALYSEFYKEFSDKIYPKIGKRERENYYCSLIEWLKPTSNCMFYLARKGRRYVGFIHSQCYINPFGQFEMNTLSCFVQKGKRKLGIGKDLAEKTIEEAKNIGISVIKLNCQDNLLEQWGKFGAKKVSNVMIKEL